MYLKIIFFCSFLLSLPALSFECSQQQAKEIIANYQWYTEDYPPYNYINKHGELVGIYPEVLQQIYKELKLHITAKEIITVPWARLFYTLETSTEHAAFSMLKTPERAKKFQLVTLPVMTKVSVMVLNENKKILVKKNLEDLTYSIVREDIGEHLLDSKLNIKHKVKTTSANSMLSMLIHNRVDAVAYAELVAHFQMNRLGYTNKTLVPIFTLKDELKTSFVFHKSTPHCVTKLFAKTISKLDEKGEITRIVKKYQH
jgi:polar amino acid transport system substrate-binding protein